MKPSKVFLLPGTDLQAAPCGVDAKKDVFGEKPEMLTKIEQVSFYAGFAGMSVHHTMGGTVINAKPQEIDRRGKMLPKLHAVGELTGGIHGTNCLGGNAICDIFTFGRLTGIAVAKGECFPPMRNQP